MLALFMCGSLMLLACGTYLIWPSRWNVFAHMQLGFSLIAYIIPIFKTHLLRHFSPALERIDAEILLVGALAYAAGLYIGALFPGHAMLPLDPIFARLPPTKMEHVVQRRAKLMLFASILGLAGCFAAMGFVPAFAANPFAAKFFRGYYAHLYHPVEIPFRTFYFFIVTLIPITFAIWWQKRRPVWLLLSLLSVLTMAVCLTRGPVATGGLMVLGLICARRREWSLFYLILLLFIFPIGAGFYKIIGLRTYHGSNIWQVISIGAPDVPDQLNFLRGFLTIGSWTWGRTFWGGLIPSHYLWNPSIYSLDIINNFSNVNKVISGGLRIPAPLWGYTAFGWWGVVLVPGLSGIFTGNLTNFLKKYVTNASILQATLAMVIFSTAGVFYTQFYTLSIYWLPPLFITICVGYVFLPRASDWPQPAEALSPLPRYSRSV